MSTESRRQLRIRLYIPRQVATNLGAVLSEEYFWRMSSFASSLIVVGWVIHMLGLRDDPKFLHDVLMTRELKRGGRKLNALVRKGRVSWRPYPLVRSSWRGCLITVSLSSGLLRMIGRYADAVERSRNDVLAGFLQHGLDLYCQGKAVFLKVESDLKKEL